MADPKDGNGETPLDPDRTPTQPIILEDRSGDHADLEAATAREVADQGGNPDSKTALQPAVADLANRLLVELQRHGVPYAVHRDGPDVQVEIGGDPAHPLWTEVATIAVHDEGDYAELAVYAHKMTPSAAVAAVRQLLAHARGEG